MSELDQTIEELEAEVLAELEETADAPKKGSVPAEGKKKLKTVGNAEIQDGGKAVVDPDAASSPTDVAAIIIEPVQGEGGFYAAPTEFLVALRKICDDHGIVLIADEIQSGFSRTGKMFNMEYSGVEPDLITMAKGIAGGFPIAAVVGKSDIMDAPLPGGLGGTYGGSPVACAAALAVLEIIEEENLIQRSNEIGALFNEHLSALKSQYPSLILEVRNSGSMIAMELIQNDDAKQSNTALTQAVIANAAKHGLILLACGFYGNVIRFLPALTASNEIIEEGLAKFTELFNELAK